jgi:hypothetical protein
VIRKILKKLIPRLKDPRVAIPAATVLGVVLIGGGTWFVTRSWMIAIAVALAIALIVLIVILVRTLGSGEREERLIGGLEESDGAARAPAANDPNSVGIRSTFNQALMEIRRSRLGPQGIFELPWWLTLGPTGSGKTELIRNAGLDVPAEFAHSLQSGPTSGCHFILTNQAVILDTAGQFVDAGDEASEDWETLLRLLKKHRASGPLEGILIGLSAASLVSQDPARTTEIARALRRRLNETAEALGFDVPIYVVVTQIDQIRGFGEFIAALPAERTREAFGWTNDRRDVADMAAAAAAALAPIYDQLDQILPELLLREPDLTRRRDLFLFPEEMRALSHRVVDVLRDAFAPSVYNEVPFLRGVYFTSALRGGASLSSVATRLGQDWCASVAQQATAGGGVFTSGLFREIMIGDDELAVESTSLGGRSRNIIVGLTAVTSLACLAFAGVSFVGNFSSIRDLEAKARRLLDVPSSLEAADSLRKSIVSSRSPDAAVGFPMMAKTRDRAADRASDTFRWAIEREHIRPAKQRINGVLVRADHDAFEALAVLAMDVSWLASRAESDATYRPNIVQYTSFDGSERDREAFSAGYDAFVRWAPESRIKALIKDERNAVLESATSLLDLRRLEEWSQRRSERQPPVQYADFGIEQPDATRNATVMGAYTRKGWEGLVRDLVNAVEDSGGAAEDNIRRFRNGYVTRFDRSWREFLLSAPTRIEPSIAVFESPHLALFERLAEEVAADLPRNGEKPAWMSLAEEIRNERPPEPDEAAEGGDSGPPLPWIRYKQALDQVGLDAASVATQTGDRPLQVALSLGDSSSSTRTLNLLEELFPLRNETVESRKLRLLLAMPVFDAGRAVLEAAEPELSRRWYEAIYRPYQIEGQDPMTLYNPNGGALSTFMQEDLGPFFDRDEPRRVIGDLRLPMSETFLSWLADARSLQRALFPGAGAALEIPVRLEGIPSQILGSSGAFVTRRDLRLDCASSVQTFEYREGTSIETLVWRPDCKQVTLRIWIRSPSGATRELLPRKEWTGPLALPEFLREGKQVSKSRYQWNLKYDNMVVRVEYRLRAGTALLGFAHKPPPSGLRGERDAI